MWCSWNISSTYLEQLLLSLKNSGLVIGIRGPNGGYKLATSSENMNKDPDIIFADVPSGLFKTRGFAYDVKDNEKKFLMEISKKL